MFDSASFETKSFSASSFDLIETPAEVVRVRYTRPKEPYAIAVVTTGFGGVRIQKGDPDAV